MAYMNDIRSYPTMSPDDEFNAFCELRNGNDKIREHIIRSNQRFVVSVAKQIANNENLVDAINEGNIGLIEAIERFDHTKGFKFISFAIHDIRRRITEFVRYTAPTIRPNRSARVSKAKHLRDIFFSKNGYEISDDELRDALGAAHFYDVNKLNTHRISEYDDSASSTNLTLVEENIDNEYYIKTINKLLCNLKPRERDIISLYYGLNGGISHTTSEISRIVGVSNERVRQIKSAILYKLKNMCRTQNIAI